MGAALATRLTAPAQCWLVATDSSVQYLRPYYDAMEHWDPPPDDEEERKAGRKRKARVPFVWLLIYRHLSGSGHHPRPFDHGMVENLNLFLFAKKPYAHRVHIQAGEAANRNQGPSCNI